MDREALITQIIDSAYKVHETFCPGYLESVYRNALVRELKLRGIRSQIEAPIPVRYKGEVIADFRADIFVENSIIVEIKAVKETIDIDRHELQLVNYLKATGIEVGLLFNFGTDVFKPHKKYKDYKPKDSK